jgi:hypothetical protein
LVSIFLTVDTEIRRPFTPGGPSQSLPPGKTDFSAELARDLYGKTASGEYGIGYQLETLKRYGLHATYFVDPFFSMVAGSEPLKDIVTRIVDAGQDVQLHAHTEWLGDIEDPDLPVEGRLFMWRYNESEQTAIIRTAAQKLRACGASGLCAFRAGGWGADGQTLTALAALGFKYDSSLNAPYLGGACRIPTSTPGLQPVLIEGIWELPVTYFLDFTRRQRPLAICACSFAETRAVLEEAERRSWRAVVIVLHSFELIRRSAERSDRGRPAPSRVALRRFERLCDFLARNSDRFRTTMFSEIRPEMFDAEATEAPIRSTALRTLGRVGEQVISRYL